MKDSGTMSLKIEVLNFLEKASYRPLPTEVPVSTYDKEEGWFHFHQKIWHPLGIVKASAVRGKVTKKDQVVNAALKIEMEIAVDGEHSAQYDPCIQVTHATTNTAYWFRAVCPKMNCQAVLRFRVVDDDSIAPLEHVIKVGTGVLDWTTKTEDENPTTEETEDLPQSPRKRGGRSQATPVQQSKGSLVLQETPASSRKRTRGGDSVETPTITRVISLDLEETGETEEDAPRSSRHSSRKRRHTDAIMIEEDDEEEEEERVPVVASARSGRRSSATSTSEPVPPSSSSTKRSTERTKATPGKSSSKESLVLDESSDGTIDYDDATLLLEASTFFETLRAAPIAPALVPKNRLEFHLPPLPPQKGKDKDKEHLVTIQGPLMSLSVPASLMSVLHRDMHTTSHYITAILRRYLYLRQMDGPSSHHKPAKAQQQRAAEEAQTLSTLIVDNISSPTVHALFDQLGPRCIGVNQEKTHIKHLRALFEDVCEAHIFVNDEEKRAWMDWREREFGGAVVAWADILGPLYFVRFLFYVVTSSKHPIGTCVRFSRLFVCAVYSRL